MKFKSSFITNSSSSSFVIALKTTSIIDDETLVKYPFLKKYMEIVKKFLEGEVIENEDELIEWAKDRYWIKSEFSLEKLEESEKEEYDEIKKYLGKGYQVRVFDVEYAEETKSEILYSLADNENFIVIRGE